MPLTNAGLSPDWLGYGKDRMGRKGFRRLRARFDGLLQTAAPSTP